MTKICWFDMEWTFLMAAALLQRCLVLSTRISAETLKTIADCVCCLIVWRTDLALVALPNIPVIFPICCMCIVMLLWVQPVAAAPPSLSLWMYLGESSSSRSESHYDHSCACAEQRPANAPIQFFSRAVFVWVIWGEQKEVWHIKKKKDFFLGCWMKGQLVLQQWL